MLDWIPQDRVWKWFFGALAFGFAWLALEAVARAIFAIRNYGFRAYARSVFRMEPENFRIFGVLALIAVAMALMYSFTVG